MSAIPYMPLWVADYLADTQDLMAEEHGAYLLLLMHYWHRGTPLPDDPDRLAFIAKVPNGRWPGVAAMLKRFFVVEGGFWRHSRCERELAKARAKIEKAVIAGKKSAEARKANSNSTDAAVELQPQANLEPTYSELRTQKEENTEPVPSTEQDAARAKDVKSLVSEMGRGLGAERHGGVPVEDQRRVCQALSIADAGPLVTVFDKWRSGKGIKARTDVGQWFFETAPTLWKNNPKLHDACQPIAEEATVSVARPSSALASSAIVQGERHAAR